MDNVQPYDVWKRRQQDAAAASSIIQSSDENPDKVADSLNLAREFSAATGKPAPPPQMVAANPDVFQRQIDDARNKALLSTARKTATWYGENPMAVLLAKDDVYNLCSFEEMAQRFGQLPKAFGDVRPRAKEPTPSSTNPEILPSASSAARQQAPASNTVAPDTQAVNPAEDDGSNQQPLSSPVDPVGSNAPSAGPQGEPIQPAAHLAGPAAETATPDAQAPALSPRPTTPITDNALSAPEDGLSEDDGKKEELIAEIRNARNLSPEQYEVLKEKVRTQPWFEADTATLYLEGIYEGRVTGDEINDVNARLRSRYSKVTTESGIQNFKEFGKGTATGVVVGSGRIVEGTGQLLSANSSESGEKKALVAEIARAGSLTPDEVDQLRLKIDQQNIVPRDLAQRIMSEVLAGDTVPEDVAQRFGPLLKELSENLQHGGEHVADYGKTMLPAAPGYENSVGRLTGETFGQVILATGATLLIGPAAGLVVESARAAGDGTAAAREANLSEDEQTKAAMLYAPTALVDLIPFGKAASSVLKYLPLNTVAQHVAKTIFKEGAAQASQLVAQNTIKHYLIDPNQEIFEKFKDTFIAGGLAGVGKELLLDLGELGIKALTRRRGSSRISASSPEAAIQSRQQFEEMATTVESSKFRERAPEKHRDYSAQVLKDTDAEYIYASPDAHTKYAEATGGDPFGLNGSHAMQVAKDTGSDIKTPASDYLAKSTNSKADADFRDSMRFSPGAFNYSEATASHLGAPTHRPVPTEKRSNSNAKPIFLGDLRVGDAAPGSYVQKTTARLTNSGDTQRNPSGLSFRSPHQTRNR